MSAIPPSQHASDTPILPPTAPGQIEIWKKIVDVQQHFNDLELRIRNFALVVTGAFLGLGGYAIKDGGCIMILGHEVSVAGLIVLSALLPLIAFYFMDRFWYHRLLDGAVKAGIDAELALKALGYAVDLGSQISKASPFVIWPTDLRVHSKTKMDMFYGMLVVTLLLVAAFVGYGVPTDHVTVPGSTGFAGQFAPPGANPTKKQEDGRLPRPTETQPPPKL